MQPSLYFLVQEGRLYATHNNDRSILIASGNSRTIFKLRSAIIDNIDLNNRLLTNYKRTRKNTTTESLQLTGVVDTSKESVKYKYMGVTRIPFDLVEENSLTKRFFDFFGADIFVVEDMTYRSEWNSLTLNGIRLDRESYRSVVPDSYEKYLQYLLDIS